MPGATPGRLPKFMPPQLATLVDKAPEGDGWLHELKFDGYRIVARLADGRARLLSRRGLDWTESFPSVAEGVARLPVDDAIVDGEVAVFLPGGTTSFQALQQRSSAAPRGDLRYVVFDLLHMNGQDLTGARLEDRKALLARLIEAARDAAPLKYSDHVVGSGPEFAARACRMGLEGIISKKRDSVYQGARTTDWLKVKCLREQEVVIGGYTDPEGSRIGIGALLAGFYDDGRLVYAGKVGTGFSDKTLRDLHQRLGRLEQSTSPFTPPPTGVGRTHWVRPKLVAQVTFGEWTADGRMRHPSFLGLREDKPATDVVRETPRPLEAAVADGARSSARTVAVPSRVSRPRSSRASPPPIPKAASKRSPSPAARRPSPARQARAGAIAEVAGVRLTHADRVVYPRRRTTKHGLALFYESIAEWILPHLSGRPTALVRCPDGVEGTCFYQKHTGYWAPGELRRVKIREKKKTGEYLIVDDLAALIGLVQIGILEIHTWNSVIDRLERPDRVVFDLDPAPDVAWRRVVEAARLLRERLRSLDLESFVKTTGGKGLHIIVPFAAGITWEEGAAFTRTIAEDLEREDPKRYIAQMAKAARTGKIFIDYLRNTRGATSVAAYSTRAKPEAPVSVPIDWDELSPRLTSDHYTIANLPKRLADLRADPWARYATVRQRLPAVGRT